jgi:hypothetical protein
MSRYARIIDDAAAAYEAAAWDHALSHRAARSPFRSDAERRLLQQDSAAAFARKEIARETWSTLKDAEAMAAAMVHVATYDPRSTAGYMDEMVAAEAFYYLQDFAVAVLAGAVATPAVFYELTALRAECKDLRRDIATAEERLADATFDRDHERLGWSRLLDAAQADMRAAHEESVKWKDRAERLEASLTSHLKDALSEVDRLKSELFLGRLDADNGTNEYAVRSTVAAIRAAHVTDRARARVDGAMAVVQALDLYDVLRLEVADYTRVDEIARRVAELIQHRILTATMAPSHGVKES